MICVILAAGYATRLYPLTEHFPKPLLQVGGKTILDWLTEDLESTGEVREYVVVTNHRFAEHFRQWAAEKPFAVTVLFSIRIFIWPPLEPYAAPMAGPNNSLRTDTWLFAMRIRLSP